MIVNKLNREEMIDIIENIFHPMGKDLTAEDLDRQLLVFCLNCPDPASAMSLVVEAPRGATANSVVNEALALPRREVATLSEDELSMDHPLRHWELER
ncbi:hypothetical protein ACN9MJ_13065 [Acidovorax facilis]|uniref:hypothetical protein n=1 Tax=Acidovorax facilis TaxID=12917 RepID=UPI003CEE9174